MQDLCHRVRTHSSHHGGHDGDGREKVKMESEWTEFVGYDEDGIPIFITVRGIPEAN